MSASIKPWTHCNTAICDNLQPLVNILFLGLMIDSTFVTDLKVKIKLMFTIHKKKATRECLTHFSTECKTVCVCVHVCQRKDEEEAGVHA